MEYFTYLPQYQLLVCKSCKAAKTFSQIKPHLQQTPHQLNSEQVLHALTWAGQLDILDNNQALSKLPYPIPLHSFIPSLGEPREHGFRCKYNQTCHFIGISLRRIRDHLRREHNWHSQARAGRPGKSQYLQQVQHSLNEPWESGILYQQLFRQGPRSEYFQVLQSVPNENTEPESLQQAFEARALAVREKEAQAVEQVDDSLAPNPWLRRLGSAQHLTAFSDKKDFLRGLISLNFQLT